jgi:signal peptidase I
MNFFQFGDIVSVWAVHERKRLKSPETGRVTFEWIRVPLPIKRVGIITRKVTRKDGEIIEDFNEKTFHPIGYKSLYMIATGLNRKHIHVSSEDMELIGMPDVRSRIAHYQNHFNK